VKAFTLILILVSANLGLAQSNDQDSPFECNNNINLKYYCTGESLHKAHENKEVPLDNAEGTEFTREHSLCLYKLGEELKVEYSYNSSLDIPELKTKEELTILSDPEVHDVTYNTLNISFKSVLKNTFSIRQILKSTFAKTFNLDKVNFDISLKPYTDEAFIYYAQDGDKSKSFKAQIDCQNMSL